MVMVAVAWLPAVQAVRPPPLPKVTGMWLPAVMAVRPSQVTVIQTRLPAEMAVHPSTVVSVSPIRPLLWVVPPSVPLAVRRKAEGAIRSVWLPAVQAVRPPTRGHHMYM